MNLTVPRSTVVLTVMLLTAVFVGVFPSHASAAPRWVNDEIRITFRAGPGDEFRIIGYLNTGARLETATPPADRFPAASMEGWTFLRNSAGVTGWVQDQYIGAQPPARIRIDAVIAERDSARERATSLAAELTTMQSDRRDLTAQLAESENRIAELEAQFAAARGGYELVETNRALQQTAAALRERNEALQRETEELSDRSLKEWFMIGAGVLAAGIIMGLILPSLRKKRDPWGSGSL